MEHFSDMELERDSDGEEGSGDDSSPLSFRYLEIENGKEDRRPWTPPPPQDVFYFFSDFPAVEKHRMSDSAVEINGTQKWDYFRSHSFSGKRESGSGSERSRSDSRKVNISSLTTMSAASRRRMFMFGPVRFKPEMDLVAIRERQRRRLSPKRVLPSAVADEGVIEKAGGRRSERRGAGSRLWAAVAKRLSCFKVESVAD